ncbi:complement regulator-acquiring protein (plasmid) [Borreliella spielmanii]|uniref:Complement regulator acquiring protein 1 n=1 Tax=Borreliella spielmanii A14S TaxID=498742 RepID=C0RC73_9SPIR|nr:complement regulator-acquiring protein [Borreliella spielmanii]ACN53294.1 complement regulator acquiring protein 1 [Borreliella spielmanii A14S]WKC83103.1 complement regulator-acquiring protein [Borreliella spielmanii]
MIKTKLNIIIINIMTTILALICISCAVNKINPKPNKYTNTTENSQDFENKSQDSNSFNQESLETILLELKAIGKKLEAQKEQEDTAIAKIISEQCDFLSTFKIGPYDLIVEENQTEIKRIIYSSLNYETQKINTLKEILEKLKKNNQYHTIVGSFINHISWRIQFRLSEHLKTIKDKLSTLSKKEAEETLLSAKHYLTLKQRFAKTLTATLEAYSQNSQQIKTDEEKLANHMNDNYKEFDSLKSIH